MVSETATPIDTAAALAEIEGNPNPTQAAPEAPSTDSTGGSNPDPSAGGKDGESPDSSSSAGDGEQGSDGASDFDAAFAKVTGTQPDEVSRDGAELPGRSLEDAAADIRQQAANDYARIMQNAETDFRQRRQAEGYSAESIDAAWQAERKNYAALHSGFEDYNLLALDNLLRETLSEDEVAEYEKRDLVARAEDGSVLPLSTRRNGIKAVLALREQSINAQWEEKLTKGEILTKSQGKALYEEGLSDGEGRKDSLKSGDTPNGASSGTSGEDFPRKSDGSIDTAASLAAINAG